MTSLCLVVFSALNQNNLKTCHFFGEVLNITSGNKKIIKLSEAKNNLKRFLGCSGFLKRALAQTCLGANVPLGLVPGTFL